MTTHDAVVVGAGAAGLATAIFARRADPGMGVAVVDGATRPGAKILVSGGSRCNVTNTVVTERDFWGGKRTIIRRVLARLPVRETRAFFEELGVRLKEEPGGKLFPVTDRSRDVLDALLGAVRALDVPLHAATRVNTLSRDGGGFRLGTSRGEIQAAAVVLATGGLSLPKTGSDGGGLELARRLGHTIVPTTAALVPLMLGTPSFHQRVSGVALDVEMSLASRGRDVERIKGALLWTHFGISGPAALDVSRHWLRAQLEGSEPALTLNLLAGAPFEAVESSWIVATRDRSRASVRTVLAEMIPASLAAGLLDLLRLDGTMRAGELSRDSRRAVVHGLTALPLPVTGSRGFNYAEVTAGGVALDEVDPVTLESRKCPGLFLAGEILDVDGRIGGFNFQWAWSSARVAGEGVARRLRAS